jgi:hypothetical protein
MEREIYVELSSWPLSMIIIRSIKIYCSIRWGLFGPISFKSTQLAFSAHVLGNSTGSSRQSPILSRLLSTEPT